MKSQSFKKKKPPQKKVVPQECAQNRYNMLHEERMRNEVESRNRTAIKGHIGSVRSLSFSSDSGMIVSSSEDKTIKGWNVLKNNFMFSLSGHTDWVRQAKLSPDSRLVVLVQMILMQDYGINLNVMILYIQLIGEERTICPNRKKIIGYYMKKNQNWLSKALISLSFTVIQLQICNLINLNRQKEM